MSDDEFSDAERDRDKKTFRIYFRERLQFYDAKRYRAIGITTTTFDFTNILYQALRDTVTAAIAGKITDLPHS